MSVVAISSHPRYAPVEEPLTRAELQAELHRGKATIFAWTNEGMPVHLHAPGGNLYILSDVLAWLEREKGWSNYGSHRTRKTLPTGGTTE
jgi:hypothetical protein